MTKLSLYGEGDEKRNIEVERKSRPGYSDHRTEWRRDYARVIHSPSFRRLQGKTQLFYGNEATVRNRLTHSLEVAQIAKAIAIKINSEYGLQVEQDIVEVAALVHDLGHPPFGHNGEKALNERMKLDGGFEGNAQTLRILTKLEKKQKQSGSNEDGFDGQGEDLRGGLNLTYRTLASALKYDREIPLSASGPKLNKGYYHTEASLVDDIKKNVLGSKYESFKAESRPVEFKTVECSIMDIADDIAYSTYDIEDAFKAGFINPLELVIISPTEESKLEKIRSRASDELEVKLSLKEVRDALTFLVRGALIPNMRRYISDLKQRDVDMEDPAIWIGGAAVAFQDARHLASNGYRRIRFTSLLVDRFIRGIIVDINGKYPALSSVYLEPQTAKLVEILKQYAYFSIIESPRLKIPEYRGKEIVTSIFDKLTAENGHYLLPNDFQRIYTQVAEPAKRRLITDFIAGMTDQYALEFYNRLHSDVPSTIFSPNIS